MNTLGVDNEAKQTIEVLQAELKKTKERLQAVEELKGQTGMSYIICNFYDPVDFYFNLFSYVKTCLLLLLTVVYIVFAKGFVFGVSA